MAGSTLGFVIGKLLVAAPAKISGVGPKYVLQGAVGTPYPGIMYALDVATAQAGAVPVSSSPVKGYSGTHKIAVQINLIGVGHSNIWVALIPDDLQSNSWIAAQLTPANGLVTFNNLSAGRFRVEVHDPTGTYDGQAPDWVNSVPM